MEVIAMDCDLIVSDIKEITKKKRLIYINGNPEFALYSSELRKYNIKINEIIDNSTYSAIVDDLLSKRSKMRMMYLLQAKDYTESEMRRKLKGDHYPEKCIDEAIDYALVHNYINDRRYADTYVNFKIKNKSRKQIEVFLMGKGLDRNIISDACDSVYEEYSDEEVKLAVKLLIKKKFDFSEMSYETKQKSKAFLYQRGFSLDSIEKALDIVAKNA